MWVQVELELDPNSTAWCTWMDRMQCRMHALTFKYSTPVPESQSASSTRDAWAIIAKEMQPDSKAFSKGFQSYNECKVCMVESRNRRAWCQESIMLLHACSKVGKVPCMMNILMNLFDSPPMPSYGRPDRSLQSTCITDASWCGTFADTTVTRAPTTHATAMFLSVQ